MSITKTASAPVAEPESTLPAPAGEQDKAWDLFTRARFVPVDITCSAYKPVHLSDPSCHTRLPIRSENVVTHILHEHSGGFVMKFRKGEGRTWPGWKELRDAGVHIQDFRCNVCDHQLPINERAIDTHMKPHRGKYRNAYEQYKHQFCFTLSFRPATS